MTAPSGKASILNMVREGFPFLARFSLDVSAGLSIKDGCAHVSINGKGIRVIAGKDKVVIDSTESVEVGESSNTVKLAGSGPAVGRVGDNCGALAFGPIAGLWYQPTALATWLPVATNPNDSTPAPPDPSFAGTPIKISTGSGKVTSG